MTSSAVLIAKTDANDLDGLIGVRRLEFVEHLRSIIQPRLRETGWVELDDRGEKTGYQKMAFFDEKYVDPDDPEFEVEGILLQSPGFVAESVIGLSESGIVIGTCPCVCTQDWDDLPIEALIELVRRLETITWEKL